MLIDIVSVNLEKEQNHVPGGFVDQPLGEH